ncbi:circularly permuted type 2 ATP-grasp protein [Corynebacterium provencense]|uniref:circularly permuted type 2 ATP-grasp protein n=1 Tax=Corynebacterium provencense TaxID=1737425 RepID=UPI0009901D73|nr:circularly permuted type 2 ATP-grasp protein [Corynebacterium provencense]
MEPLEIIDTLDPSDVASRRRAADSDLVARGVTFGVKDADGKLHGHEVFDIEPVPRVIGAATWDRLARGVEQRTRALDRFLDDVYTVDSPEDAAIVRAGRMDAAIIARSPGYTPLGRSYPAGRVRTRVAGADLVCDDRGRWAVLEDNVRMPSGLTFALAARSVTRDHWPELLAGVRDRLRPVTGALEMFCATVEDAAPPPHPDLPSGPDAASRHVVIVSEGDHDPTRAEQRAVAEAGGFHIRTCDLLRVEQDGGVPVVVDLASGRRVDVIYLRVEENRLAEGVPGIGGPLAAGTVGMANAPGNGLADDKAVYASVPEMVRFYLGEEPRLGQVPTWLCADPSQRMEVLDRLDELVVKPVDGYGGAGITIGPECSGARLAERRAEILARPEAFIAQERVELSTLPALDGTRRHVDLRMFSLLTGSGASTVPAGLTRVARAGSLIVNSSRGGGGRDTWIVASSPEELSVGSGVSDDPGSTDGAVGRAAPVG